MGALAEYFEVPGVDHGYNIMSDATDTTRAAYAHIADHVRRATGAPEDASDRCEA